jgi:cbb3-type cytochrome oxidase subunit 1
VTITDRLPIAIHSTPSIGRITIMRRLDLWFLLLATLSLLTGVGMGIWMGIAHDFQFAPVHAHLNLLGWTSLALFGLTYRAYPALSTSPLARIHFGLAVIGAVTFPAGIALSITGVTVAVAIVGALIWFGAVAVFLMALVRLALGSERHPAAFPAPAE